MLHVRRTYTSLRQLSCVLFQCVTQVCQMIMCPVSLIFCGHLDDKILLDGAALAMSVSALTLTHQIFHRKHKNVSTIHVFPPHWHDTGSWNHFHVRCPGIRYAFTYSILSISWVLMFWRRKESGHQQPCYRLCCTGISRALYVQDFKKTDFHVNNDLWPILPRKLIPDGVNCHCQIQLRKLTQF